MDKQNEKLPAVEMESIGNVSIGNSAETLLNKDYFAQLQRVAGMLATSNMVPESYRNVADCAVALHMARTSGIEPMFLLQNTQVVRGVPSWKGTAIIAMVNNSSRFIKHLNWEFEKDADGNVINATCFTEDVDGIRKEASVSWEIVSGEGWNVDKPTKYNGIQKSKWNTMREQMFVYRSATFFARRYCPDILLGFRTEGEAEDIVEINPIGKSDKAAAIMAMGEPEAVIEETVPEQASFVELGK